MTILEPTLYANGALRLTRHGAGKGDTVLVYVPTNSQFSVPDGETRDLTDEIEKRLGFMYPDDVFDELQHDFADLPKAPTPPITGPNFYHD